MKKLTEWLTKPFLEEDINLPVKVGDTILVGRFKNKKMVVKSIGKDKHGMPTINGRKATTFRIPKKDDTKIINSKKQEVTEGVEDPGIFKAVFLAGGPGSGKTYVTKQLFGIPDRYNISMTGLKMVNSDKELKFLLNKYGFGTDLDKMPDELFNQLTNPKDKDYSGLRDYSKELTKQRMKQYQDGKLGMIIDGTGHDYNKLAKMKRELEQDGYDTYMVFVITDLETAQKRNQQRDRILPPDLVKKSWTDVMSNGKAFKALFKGNISYVDNSKPLSYMQAMRKFETLMKKEISKFIKKPIKSKIAKSWIKKQQILKRKGLSEAPRVPRKKGQHRGSKSHSDLYTDENPKGTIKGLKFATVKDAQASVSKIKNSGKSHAHKIQAAVAMEQRAREMGKSSQAAVYRAFINKMKKKTKKKNEDVIPSPSRKGVEKMKKKGNTSVPYGSGYKKVDEQKEIKKVVGIYGGRFQPFGPHHKKTYEWLKKKVDEAYIVTSDLKSLPRHPMNFKEKVRHMKKMGIPSNRIVMEKTPYRAENTLKKFDEETTAVIYIFGKKDAGRLKGGAYFDDYKKNKNKMVGYRKRGYILTAPHVSVSVGGKEVSGTVMRQLLGSPDYEKNRKKLFKKAFGYFDQGIFNMMTNKFKKLFESIDEFLIKNDISKLLKESTTALSPTDDGPPTFYKGFGDYKKFSKKWINDMYAGTGWEVLNYILGKHAVNPDFDYTLKYTTVPAVAYGRKQSGSYGSRFGTNNPIQSYKDYIENTVLRDLGYQVLKWMGITPDGKKYTGVEVETPVLPGVGKDNVANTEDDKLDLKERINLDDYVKLLIEQDDVMDKKIKYKTKDGNEKEVTVGGALKQGEEHPAYKQAKSMTDKDEKPDTSKKIQPAEFDRDYDEKNGGSTKKRMDKIKSFGKDPHGNLYLGDEEVGYEPKVHKAQYVTETDDSIVIGTPHMDDKDPKAGEFIKKQVVPMVQDFIKKHGAENVVFLGEGGFGDGHNYHEGTEQELVGKMVEKAGGSVDTWDGEYNNHDDGHKKAGIYKDLAKKMKATPSQMTGAIYSNIVGQGDDPKEDTYLTDDGKQWLKDNGYKGGFPPSGEEVNQLFDLNYPEDGGGKPGSNPIAKAQLDWNQLRRDNMARKTEEYKKQGKKVLVVPGATHGSAINAQSKSKKEIKEGLILEGGAYGHMNHPFDDKNITFSDLKQIIINGLGGKLNREDGVTEKLDGQNLMVSWVNDKLVTARNKGQLKNFGATAMDTAGVASKFAGRGDIKNAFVFAMKDLSKSIGRLSDAQKEKIFGNGKRWMNLEVIYPKSLNVIDYDKAQIVFHGTLEYDKSAKAIGQPKGSARMLAGMIKQVNQNVQKNYTIGKPQFLTVPKVQNFGKKKRTYLGRLNKLQKQYALNDSDTLSKYHQSFWEEFIFNASKQYNYKIPNKVLLDLTKRWAFSDKSYKIPTIKKDIKNKKFLDWVLSFDKNDHQKWVKQNMKPFEVLFFDVGAEILKNISGYLVASPDKAVQKIRKDVINAIKTVKSSKDIKKIETLKLQLDKLEKIGGLSSIVPSEGIVFKYKGKTYKFTGAFAPVNQILGLLNF